MDLLARLPSDATLQQFYQIAWHPIPNLAMDAIVPPLLRFMPLAAAGKLFVLTIFLLLAGGAALLHRALFQRWSAWPCLVFLLLYDRLLLWGIVNYLFGLGLALVALAAMIALGGRGVVLRLAAGAVFALVLYFAHLMAFGVYAVLLIGVEAGAVLRRMPMREAAARLAVAILPLLLPLLVMAYVGGGAGEAGLSFSKPWRKLDLLFSVFDLYHRPFDVACFALAVLGLGYAYWRRWLVLAPALALALAVLALLYLAMPSQMMGASGVDRRLPLALALVLCAGSAWVAPRPRLERIYLGAALAMLVLRLVTVAASWHDSDRDYRAILAGLDAVPAGSRIAVAFPPDAVNVTATPLVHLTVLAAARRDAFVPTLFAQASQQPIALTPPYRALAARTSPDRLWRAFVTGGAKLDAAEHATLDNYDYIAFAGIRPFTLEADDSLALVFVAPRFALYRIAR